MKLRGRLKFVPLLLFPLLCLQAAGDAQSSIRAALDAQVEAWNRGDVSEFVKTYAADCVFVGKSVAHGRAQLEARYNRDYPNAQAMGYLTFGALDVRPLTSDVAIVTGEWHIQRSGQSTNQIGGLFSLVFRREAEGRKIALDHTS